MSPLHSALTCCFLFPLRLGAKPCRRPEKHNLASPLRERTLSGPDFQRRKIQSQMRLKRLSDLACPAGRRNLSRSLLLGFFASLRHLLHSCTTLVPGCPESNPSLPAPQSQIQRLSSSLTTESRLSVPRFRVCSLYLVTLSRPFACPVNTTSIFGEVAQAMIAMWKVPSLTSRLRSSGISSLKPIASTPHSDAQKPSSPINRVSTILRRTRHSCK